MILMEADFLLVILPIFATLAIVLFNMLDSKQDKLNADTVSAYDHLRKYTLDPILGEIIGSKRGKHKPLEFFKTPEVIGKLSEYRKQLFKFNSVSELKGNIMLMLKLSLKTTICILLVTVVFILINEFFINSVYNTFGISILHAVISYGIIFTILLMFFFVFLGNFFGINASFKTQIIELKGGLP